MPSSGLLEKWVGKALVRPSNGSDQQRDGYAGAYALVACSADSCLGAIRLLADELLENDVYLSGFEWFLRIPDFDRKLSEEEDTLVTLLDRYPVQFRDFHWFK